MNRFKLIRYYTPPATAGRLYDSDGKLFCETVERPHHSFSEDHPCIPEGVYTAKRYNSPTHGHVWMLQDVPGRTEIEIHVANWPMELLGCIAPGQAFGCDSINNQWGVKQSKVAFDRLMQATAGEVQIEITITHAELS